MFFPDMLQLVQSKSVLKSFDCCWCNFNYMKVFMYVICFDIRGQPTRLTWTAWYHRTCLRAACSRPCYIILLVKLTRLPGALGLLGDGVRVSGRGLHQEGGRGGLGPGTWVVATPSNT